MKLTEVPISGTAGYELTAATWLPGDGKILFVTTPVRAYHSERSESDNEKCVVIGFLNVSTCALGSIVTEPCRLPRVCKIAVWKNGIFLCSAAGLAHLDFETGVTRLLVAAQQIDNQVVCDVAVHKSESVWFVSRTENSQVTRLFQLKQNGDIVPIKIPIGIESPASILFGPNRTDLYAACGHIGTIYKFHAENSLLSDKLRLTFLPLSSATTSLRMDATGSLYVASLCEILRFSRLGEFVERFETQRPVIDFVVASSSKIYILHENGWFLLEKKLSSRRRRYFIQPRI